MMATAAALSLVSVWLGLVISYYAGTAAGRGGTADSFTNGHENFMKQAVRELYRAGDLVGRALAFGHKDRAHGVAPGAHPARGEAVQLGGCFLRAGLAALICCGCHRVPPG